MDVAFHHPTLVTSINSVSVCIDSIVCIQRIPCFDEVHPQIDPTLNFLPLRTPCPQLPQTSFSVSTYLGNIICIVSFDVPKEPMPLYVLKFALISSISRSFFCLANILPSITENFLAAIAFAKSRENLIPPSAIKGIEDFFNACLIDKLRKFENSIPTIILVVQVDLGPYQF